MRRAVGIALLLGTVVVAHADDGDAERRFEDAKRWSDRHWTLPVFALRDAVRASRARSGMAVRALRKMATVLERAGRREGALAAYEAAARATLPGESARFTSPLAAARLLLAEDDLEGAVVGLERVADDAGHASPAHTERALALLVEVRFEQDDGDGLARLVRRLERLRARPAVLIVAWGRAGEQALGSGDARGARRALRRARAVFARAENDPGAAKAWLDLPLRKVVHPTPR